MITNDGIFYTYNNEKRAACRECNMEMSIQFQWAGNGAVFILWASGDIKNGFVQRNTHARMSWFSFRPCDTIGNNGLQNPFQVVRHRNVRVLSARSSSTRISRGKTLSLYPAEQIGILPRVFIVWGPVLWLTAFKVRQNWVFVSANGYLITFGVRRKELITQHIWRLQYTEQRSLLLIDMFHKNFDLYGNIQQDLKLFSFGHHCLNG